LEVIVALNDEIVKHYRKYKQIQAIPDLRPTRNYPNMNLHLEQNVDLLLIENTNLQDQVKSLTKKLATQNQKYNSLSTVLQTQTGFMKEIETKVELISKREKPLREEVERLRNERNDAIGMICVNP
jgi:chromosome segregation ATPase